MSGILLPGRLEKIVNGIAMPYQVKPSTGTGILTQVDTRVYK